MSGDGYRFPDWRDIVFITMPDNYGFWNQSMQSKLMDDYGFMWLNFQEKGDSKMNLKDKVTQVVEDLCEDLASFTSLDVSNRVKLEGFESNRHRDISYIVRVLYVDGLMEDYGYTRSLIDVNVSGGTKQAYLYHHQSISTSTYDSTFLIAIPPKTQDGDVATGRLQAANNTQVVATPVVAPTPTTQVVNTGSGTTQVRKQKGDCRLEIPATWVKHLGWNDGATVYAVHENDIILKSSSDVGVNDSVLATATIVDGRLRVPKTAFDKAGFRSNSGVGHEVLLGTNDIVVKDA